MNAIGPAGAGAATAQTAQALHTEAQTANRISQAAEVNAESAKPQASSPAAPAPGLGAQVDISA